MKSLAIIGGGAAGLAAAVAAGLADRRQASRQTLSVGISLYEDDDRIGRKILVTGNGRCNFSNRHIEPHDYRSGDFVAAVLEELEHRAARYLGRGSQPNAVLSWFAHLGLVWREEGEGRLYPLSGKASSVVDGLRGALADLGVQVHCESRVDRIEDPADAGGRFALRLSDGRVEHADRVIVACGGRIFQGLLPGKTDFTEIRPVLGPLRTDTTLTRPLDNIRVRCSVELDRPTAAQNGDVEGTREMIAFERGELLFRSYGVSGIAVYNLSRFARPGDYLVIDVLPDLPEGEVDRWAGQRRSRMASLTGGRLTCGRFLQGLILPQLARVLLGSMGKSEESLCAKADAPSIIRCLKAVQLRVEGVGNPDQCQVHRGGFVPDSFSVQTLESMQTPGLYLVGEALDVDGPCGGFNLHWAWASGMLAGFSAVEACVGDDAR